MNPGHYNLGDEIRFVVTHRLIGERIVNDADLIWYPAGKDSLPTKVPLPEGYDTWAAGWLPATTVLWVQQQSGIRSYDFSDPAAVKVVAVEPDKVPPAIREALPAVIGIPLAPAAPKPAAAPPATQANDGVGQQFQKIPGTNVLSVALDDINLHKILGVKSVPDDVEQHFPAWLRSLEGKEIRIRGFMHPTYEASGLKAFFLDVSPRITNLNSAPAAWEIINIELAPRTTTDYIESRRFDVEGTFRFERKTTDEELRSLYRIENARILPLQ